MINMEVGMTKRTNGAASADYRGKDVDTGDLEVIRDLRSNVKLARWLIPILATIFLGTGGLFAWLAKRALVAEIREIIAPMEKKIERMEVRVEAIEKRKR